MANRRRIGKRVAEKRAETRLQSRGGETMIENTLVKATAHNIGSYMTNTPQSDQWEGVGGGRVGRDSSDSRVLPRAEGPAGSQFAKRQSKPVVREARSRTTGKNSQKRRRDIRGLRKHPGISLGAMCVTYHCREGETMALSSSCQHCGIFWGAAGAVAADPVLPAD